MGFCTWNFSPANDPTCAGAVSEPDGIMNNINWYY
jgi:hypothetical protein